MRINSETARNIIWDEPEHIFYQLGCDYILFVHKDTNDTRWLCSCCKLGEEWAVCRIATELLLDMIDEKITIREAFETSGNPVYFARWDGMSMTVSDVLPYDALPKTGETLELGPDRTGEYREKLIDGQ